ncbi:RNA 2',3'-cyclic phosphodiesterase [Phenylobacterium sp.]|jgi:2'-5' RNA ligase|uniref:RNA 2',3'-cyclic phosphodiesterase n=1 Tax=Phenylobacterium sp. TaxID=1871053 RepID=UPI002F41B87A
MIRLFTALALPPELAGDLERLQHGLPGARWRLREAFHITLAFYGEVREDVARDLDSALAGVNVPVLDLSLQGVGAFGEGPDIHTVWAAVVADPALERLAAACAAAARRAGLTMERRAYRPHLTLAYTRRPDPSQVAAWIQRNNLFRSPAFRLDRFGLYSSWRTRDGSAYRLEAHYPG